ncbi:MAG TPA: cupin domain-containing protein [Pyrinomonadaceae bacterium]|nr:cupin domain-containing protein [Pyrinomonadaceae bacterium]
MKRVTILLFVLLAAGFVRGDMNVSREQDAAKVNASTIVVKLDNPRVRVLDVTLKPGEKEKTHSHPAYVVYIIEGGKVRNHAADGTVAEAELKTGDVLYRDPLTHWAENIGNTTLRLVLVELKN